MRKPPARVIRAVFQSPPNPDRFSDKEWCRMVVVVLFPEEVKRQLATATVAKARALEIGRKIIEDQLYNPPDLDALNAWAEIVTLDLFPLGEVHRTLTLLNWAATQKSKGRLILSGDENGENLHELALPILDNVKSTRSPVVEEKAWATKEAGAYRPVGEVKSSVVAKDYGEVR